MAASLVVILIVGVAVGFWLGSTGWRPGGLRADPPKPTLTTAQTVARQTSEPVDTPTPPATEIAVTPTQEARPNSQTPTPRYAMLVVRSNVDGDTVSIDGRDVGSSGTGEHQLEPGRHTIAVRRFGHQTAHRTVELAAGETLAIRVRLRPEDEHEPDDATGTSPSEPDRDIIPIRKPAPVYPPHLEKRRIEGWVQLEYTVNAHGATEGVRVLQAQPPGYFDEAARQAVLAYTFMPRISKGVPVSTNAIKITLHFRMNGRR